MEKASIEKKILWTMWFTHQAGKKQQRPNMVTDAIAEHNRSPDPNIWDDLAMDIAALLTSGDLKHLQGGDEDTLADMVANFGSEFTNAQAPPDAAAIQQLWDKTRAAFP
jgi:hypothetical protein